MLLLSVVLSAAGAAPVLAQSGPPRSEAPPGNSAVDQYRESLPPAGGNARELSRRDRERLSREGRDGERLARAIERAGGVPRSSGTEGDATGGPAGGATTPERSPGSSSKGPSTSSSADGRDRATTGSSPEADTRPIAPAAAATTVGPVPIWVLLAAAAGLVGIGLILRTRVAR